MRIAVACLLALLTFDATPKGGSLRETRWKRGDFAAITNDTIDRAVEEGETVGIRIDGRGESCLLRRRAYPLRLPCRIHFRVRWSEAQHGAAYPSLHLMFNPPASDHNWWKAPITPAGGQWTDLRQTFLFHFSTDAAWQVFGMTDRFESAFGRHSYTAAEKTWVNFEIKLDGKTATVSAGGKEVGSCKADLRGCTTFTYGIGDQTSTFVELDEFACFEGR